jgi:hypothetical protein
LIAVNHDVDRRGGATADDGISLDKVRAFGRQANVVTLQHYLDDHERGAGGACVGRVDRWPSLAACIRARLATATTIQFIRDFRPPSALASIQLS